MPLGVDFKLPAIMLGIGLAAGAAVPLLFRGERPRASERASERAEIEPRTQGAPPIRAALSERDELRLRELVREELRGAREAPQPSPSKAAPEAELEAEAAPELSDEQLKNYDSARALVDGGLSRGVWTTADRTKLREVVQTLPPELNEEMLSSLIVAVNSGKVRFEGRGPLF